MGDSVVGEEIFEGLDTFCSGKEKSEKVNLALRSEDGVDPSNTGDNVAFLLPQRSHFLLVIPDIELWQL